jgi:hypothetical protein
MQIAMKMALRRRIADKPPHGSSEPPKRFAPPQRNVHEPAGPCNRQTLLW